MARPQIQLEFFDSQGLDELEVNYIQRILDPLSYYSNCPHGQPSFYYLQGQPNDGIARSDRHEAPPAPASQAEHAPLPVEYTTTVQSYYATHNSHHLYPQQAVQNMGYGYAYMPMHVADHTGVAGRPPVVMPHQAQIATDVTQTVANTTNGTPLYTEEESMVAQLTPEFVPQASRKTKLNHRAPEFVPRAKQVPITTGTNSRTEGDSESRISTKPPIATEPEPPANRQTGKNSSPVGASPPLDVTSVIENVTHEITNGAKPTTVSSMDSALPNGRVSPQCAKLETRSVSPRASSWADLFTEDKQEEAVIHALLSSVQTESQLEKVEEEKVLETVSPWSDPETYKLARCLSSHSLKHTSISLQPRGLVNTGVWCYINAPLQALVACPPFYDLMASMVAKPPGCATSTPTLDLMSRFMKEFTQKDMKEINQKELNGKGTIKINLPVGKTFAPTYVYQLLKLKNYAQAFKYGQMEDAEEFLCMVMNSMHEEMSAAMKVAHVGGGEEIPAATNGHAEPSGKNNEDDDDGWEKVGPKNKPVVTRSVMQHDPETPMSAIFRGRLRTLLSKPGEKESASVEPFFSLKLDIHPREVRCVSDALNHLVSPEALPDFRCNSRDKDYGGASRRVLIEELPPVLVLHLKCFQQDKYGHTTKLMKNVEYSVDLELNKDLFATVSRQKYAAQTTRRYKLFAVIHHHGARITNGHFTTHIYHAGLKGWVHMDDSTVTAVSLPSVMKFTPPKVPYLLFYRRMDLS